jgi:hypothetical protein
MILATINYELWLAAIAVLLGSALMNAAFFERCSGKIDVASEESAKNLANLHRRINELGASGDSDLKSIDSRVGSSEKTHLEINATVTETLAVITNEAGHKALAKHARDALSEFKAKAASESIHSHEEAYH